MVTTTAKPLSLQVNPETISDWTTPQGSVPYDMPWTVWVGDGHAAPNFVHAACNQPASGKMIFATPWSYYAKYNVDILLTILGGWNGTSKVDGTGMVTPMEWPQEVFADHTYIGGLYATDVRVSEAFVENSVTRSAGELVPYKLALYEVQFQSLPYTVDHGLINGWNPNFCEVRTKSTNESQQTPVGQYVFASDHNLSSILGNIRTYGVSYIELVAHRIPGSYAVGGNGPDASWGLSPLQSYCGTVNETEFLGVSPEKLLFDSIEQQPYGDWRGNNIYDVHLFFKYRHDGWQTGIDQNGVFLPIVSSKDFTTKPYVTQDFNSMMGTLMPPQA